MPPRSASSQVLHTLPFDSTRKMMSVIVREATSGQVLVYCKGADSAVLERLAPPTVSGDGRQGKRGRQCRNAQIFLVSILEVDPSVI